jgi:hypothetical protein
MDGNQAIPWSDTAISPSHAPHPTNIQNRETETATSGLPSRPSTSSDGKMISFDPAQLSDPYYQPPGSENHLAWDDFQAVASN